MSDTPQKKGGDARARKLSPEERREIAKRAAEARWQKIGDPESLPTATHQGLLHLGDVAVEAYRLRDGRRMISKAAMARALNLKSEGGNAFLRSMTRKGLRTAIDDDLWVKIENPQNFKRLPPDSGTSVIVDGYEGTVLIDVCIAITEAAKYGLLTQSQHFLAIQSEIIIRSAAKVGITALIDEAVGFTDRAKDEYRRLFQQFIREEFAQWEKEFPDKFPDMLYRLYGIRRFNPESTRHPRFFSRFTRKYIYAPLANSRGAILEILDEKNPVVYANGGRRFKLFQFLSDEIGLPALRAHLWQVIGIGSASTNIRQFERGFYRAFPEAVPIGHQFGLDLE
ncbi:P63C domain-containing protein [Blastochloris sulfoviridis]|nr:P63C domain-containing protein [Blastochloris sulfoviridis]